MTILSSEDLTRSRPMGACPLCGASDIRAVAKLQPERLIGSYDAVRCRACGVVFVSPMPQFSFEAIQDIYGAQYIDGQSAMGGTKRSLEILRRATRRQMDLVERYVAPGVALNVGATSEAVRVLAERGWHLRCVEASAYSAAKARERWGFDVTTARIEDFECAPGSFDFVKLGHVIEHLADPGAVLRRLAAMLRPGGVILVDTDNARGLRTWMETTVRRLLGEGLAAGLVRRLTGKNLRKRYGSLGPPLHLYAFTTTSLTRILRDSGFEILQVLVPAQGDPTWFPITEGMRVSAVERMVMRLSRIGGWLGAGDVVAVVARKP